MSLDRPWALALLAVPVLLLWLRLRAARPREAEASSLLVWSKVSQSDTMPARPRPPVAAWLEALGAALIALGLAGPALPGTAPGLPTVLLDTSPSMKGLFTPPEGARVQSSVHPEEDLSAILAGPGPVIVVTDHRLRGFPDIPGRLRVVGIGKPAFNAGITAASGVPLPDGRWRVFLTVEAFGAPGPVEGTLTIGSEVSKITVQPGRPLELVRDEAAGIPEARIAFRSDALPEDDEVRLDARGNQLVTGSAGDRFPDSHPLVRALRAAGAVISRESPAGGAGGGKVEGLWLQGGWLTIAVDIAPGEVGPMVKGSTVCTTGDPLVRDVRVDPSSTLGRRVGPGPRGPPLLSDQDGPLATVLTMVSHPLITEIVTLGFDPGGTWVERDPSFVVFAKNLVEFAAGGPARIEATGLLDPKETREAAEGETFGDVKAALEEAARPDPASRTSYGFSLLLAGALLLGGAWLAGRF